MKESENNGNIGALAATTGSAFTVGDRVVIPSWGCTGTVEAIEHYPDADHKLKLFYRVRIIEYARPALFEEHELSMPNMIYDH